MRAAVIAIVLVVAARDASAFATGDQFDLDALSETAPAASPSTVRRDGPGIPARCATPRRRRIVDLRLESDHPELFTDGWKPSQQYHLRVVLSQTWADEGNRAIGDNCGEKVTPYRPCDHNGFAIELADSHGKPVGTLAQYAANGLRARRR